MRVDRRQVLAYRASVHQLDEPVDVPGDVAVLDLGVQDTPVGSAALAIAARLGGAELKTAHEGLVTTWTVRGAPHVHRAEDLLALSRALWPWSEDDALARLDTASSPLSASEMQPRGALRLVATQLTDIVTQPMPKGDVSAALTPRIPAELAVDCRPCNATHVSETLFRAAVLPAGITFLPGRRTVTFTQDPSWPGIPETTVGEDRTITAYLRLLGPATPAHVAAFLGTSEAEVRGRWPAGLATVRVGDERRWLPEKEVDRLTSATPPTGVRLLPPADPWLQARDRALVMPEATKRKALWPSLGRPGVVLAQAEPVACWSARKRGRRLHVTVRPFHRLSAGLRRGIEEQAELVAVVRGATGAAVTFEDR